MARTTAFQCPQADQDAGTGFRLSSSLHCYTLNSRLYLYRADDPRYVYLPVQYFGDILELRRRGDFTRSEVVTLFAQRSRRHSREFFDLLVEHRLIVGDDDKDAQLKFQNLKDLGWRLGAEYLERSHDYPFFDYMSDGYQQDRERMDRYYRAAESERIYKDGSPLITPQQLDPADPRHPFSSAAALDEGEFTSTEDLVRLSIRTAVGTSWYHHKSRSGSKRKLVPSGGGRHPCSALLVHTDGGRVEEFSDVTMDFTDRATQPRFEYETYFGDNISYLGFQPKFLILILCRWEANMFRYRECRTYRSVHIDCGHIVNAIEHAIVCNDRRTHAQYNLNTPPLARYLNIDELSTGIMAGLFVA